MLLPLTSMQKVTATMASGDRSSAAACASGEQGTRGNGEITQARLAAPAQTGGRSRTRVADRAATTRTDRFAVGVGPTQAQEYTFSTPLSDMRMILALRERAEAESRKCCAMLTRRENQTSTLLPGSAQKYNPNFSGGGCYITPGFYVERGNLSLRC